VRLLLALLLPLRVLLRVALLPLRVLARRRVMPRDGWVELTLEGTIVEQWAPPRLPPIVRRFLGREIEPHVVLTRVKRLVDIVARDPRAAGLLVRLGSLDGGWASAAALRRELSRVRSAGKRVVVYVKKTADNKDYYVATASDRIIAAPAEVLAPVGSAASTLFMKDTLQRAGIVMEAAAAGRYKSAPEAFTRSDRSEFDRLQTRRLVDSIDGTLADAIAEGRKVDHTRAKEMIDRSPLVGVLAKNEGLCDALARDEDLPAALKTAAGLEKVPPLVEAPRYVEAKSIRPIVSRRKKRVGIVEVHGAIIERASPIADYLDQVAAERAVVTNLRAALESREVGAIILHVNSRGGGVGASDSIYAAARRADRDKPVIACFGDIAASGGYYVACGARAIVASPLTVTGSIGVFALLPVVAGLVSRLGLQHDVIKNHLHADLDDPLRPRTDEERAHADREVGAMYEEFTGLVSSARNIPKSEMPEIAEGRVWTGADAFERKLLDGLGGMDEALDRARTAAGGRFEDEPALVRSRRHIPRPAPPEEEEAHARLQTALLALLGPQRELLMEIAAVTTGAPRARAFAYAPIALD
jgi:protease-4